MSISVVEVVFNQSGPFKIVQTSGKEGLPLNKSFSASLDPKLPLLSLGSKLFFSNKDSSFSFGKIKTLEICGPNTIKVRLTDKEFLVSIS